MFNYPRRPVAAAWKENQDKVQGGLMKIVTTLYLC